jgi:hypothetical protein
MSASHTLTPSHSHAKPSRGARIVRLFRGHDDMPEAPDADLQDDGSRMGPRRFGLFPVRRRGSAIADAIVAVRADPEASQTLAELRETLDEAMPEPFIAPQFTGASLQPLPLEPRTPLKHPVMTEAQLAQLARVADRLRAWEPSGGPERDEDETDEGDGPDGQDEADLPPVAYLRAVMHGPDGETELGEPLGHTPLFAGVTRTISGRLIAGMYLGTNEDGYCMVDATDPEWCEDAITALTAMRDALAHGGLRPVPAEDTLLLRPVHAEGGAA